MFDRTTSTGDSKTKYTEDTMMEAQVQYHKGVLDPKTGWMITPQEAYLPREWVERSKTCFMCGDEFVLYVSDDSDPSGRPVKYCGIECRREAHRRDSREFARRQAAARTS